MEIVTPQDYENNARKRKRRSLRPCDACRKRKTRCVTKEAEPACIHCQLRGSACTFEHAPPERPGTANDEHDDRLSSQSLTSPGETRTDSSGKATSLTSGHTPQITPDAVKAEVPQVHKTMGLSRSHFAELYGLGSDMEPILMQYRPYDRISHEFSLETHAIRKVLDRDDGEAYPLTFHVAHDDKAIADSAGDEVDLVEDCVRPHGPSLVELFWRHVQPCYPILEKEVFAKAYGESYRNIASPLLAAVYLSAIRWWTYDPDLSIRPAPDAALLRRILRTSIPASYHRPKLSSIQATLLLLQCQPEDPLNPDHTYQWGLTCQAVAIAQCLGLHLDPSLWAIPQWERNLRKRIAWALYMQDRWTALAYGRPVHIHDDDWNVPELVSLVDFSDHDTTSTSNPTAADDERRSIGATGELLFIHMTRLSRVLSAVLSTFYTARSSRGQDTVLLYQRARPLLEALDAWYRDIPPALHMDVTYQRKLCFHGTLHLSYYGVAMTLLRRLARSTALPPRCLDETVLGAIRSTALQTAQAAISFVTGLRPDHLEAWWFFATPYVFSLLGSFTTLLLVTSLSTQERAFWQETLNSYLWGLRTMSKSCEPMRYAVNRLEGAILRGMEHALAVNLGVPPDDAEISLLMASHGAAALPQIPQQDVYELTDFGAWDLAAAGDGVYDILGATGLGLPQQPMLPREGSNMSGIMPREGGIIPSSGGL